MVYVPVVIFSASCDVCIGLIRLMQWYVSTRKPEQQLTFLVHYIYCNILQEQILKYIETRRLRARRDCRC